MRTHFSFVRSQFQNAQFDFAPLQGLKPTPWGGFPEGTISAPALWNAQHIPLGVMLKF